MSEDTSIASLRARVAALVEEEAALLTRAFDLSRAGGDRRGVDALFAEVQAKQVQRNSLKKQISGLLGTQRMHVAAEVWQLGAYDYRDEVSGKTVRVRVTMGPLGMQVVMPGRADPVSIERLKGDFEGPLGAEDAPQEQRGDAPRDAGARARSPRDDPQEGPAPERNARKRRR